MNDILHRLTENLVDRLHGPLKFRFILQPVTALVLAVRSGIKDAHQNRRPFFWLALSDASSRGYLLKEGWQQIGKIFLLALCLDAIYQLIVLHWFYPLEALLIAFLLAILPYLVFRGLTNRVCRRWTYRKGK